MIGSMGRWDTIPKPIVDNDYRNRRTGKVYKVIKIENNGFLVRLRRGESGDSYRYQPVSITNFWKLYEEADSD